MNVDQKFQQRWEFRRRDDDIDSSDDSSHEHATKRHKLVSSLMLLENDEACDNQRSQEKSMLDTNMKDQFNFAESSGKRIKSSKKNAVKPKRKRGPAKGKKVQKKKIGSQETLVLDDFRIFTESMITQIRTAREKIFAKMKEEMAHLVAGSSTKPRRKAGSRVQKSDAPPPQRRMKSVRKIQNGNGASALRANSKAVGDQIIADQTLAVITSNGKDKGERSISSVQQPMDLANDSHQILSSSYLALPTVITPQCLHQRTDLHLRNHILPGVAINSSALTADRANPLITSNNQLGYFSSIQQEEQFGGSMPFSSNDLAYFDKHSTQGTGFPVPLHQGLSNGFNTPSQIVLEEISRESSKLGLRMYDGAVRCVQGSHALTERFVANCISSHVNYKSDGRVLPFKSEDLSTGYLHSS